MTTSLVVMPLHFLAVSLQRLDQILLVNEAGIFISSTGEDEDRSRDCRDVGCASPRVEYRDFNVVARGQEVQGSASPTRHAVESNRVSTHARLHSACRDQCGDRVEITWQRP